MVGQPVSLSRTPSRLAAPPPELGEHTDEVLKEFGFSAKEIAALRKAERGLSETAFDARSAEDKPWTT